MKYTNEELIKIFTKLCPPQYNWRETDVQIITNSPEQILVEISCMYESPDKGFKILKRISEAFGTDNVDVLYDINESGCKTCDYGSRYGYAIRVWQ